MEPVKLEETITLRQGEKYIELPLKNILRVAMIHLTTLRIEYHLETGKSNISGFWRWIENKLGMGKEKKILM